jgi:AcrR family transcriptional regulator
MLPPGPRDARLPKPVRSPAAAAAGTRSRKGDLTRAAIVEAALVVARREGLEGLTIGVLAERLVMSKSGVFAHFGSREDLQLAVLREYALRFVDTVLRPAVRAPRGLPRVRAIVERWLALLAEEIEAGCILIGGASEYDDRPGPLRDALAAIIISWKAELLRALEQARQCGDLRPDTDCEQMVFEIYGLMLMLHQDARLLRGKDSMERARRGLQRLIDGTAVGPRGAGAIRHAGASKAVVTKPGARSRAVLAARAPARKKPPSDRKRASAPPNKNL